jgi:hypothetical protein
MEDSMKRITIALCVILTIGVQANAQKKKPLSPKSPFTTSAKSPALPTGAGIDFYRMKNKVLYLTIKNTGAKPIKKVNCSILVTDILTMKQVAAFSLVTFEYAVDVSPQQSFTAILDENQLSELKGDNIAYGKCEDYKYMKDKNGEWDRTFIPNRCTQDAFVILISSVVFTDGTSWLPPEFARVIQNNQKAKGKNEPYPQPLYKLSQLKQRRVTKQEFGELWVFIPSEGILACNSSDEERLFFIDGVKAYALNGWALDSKIDGVKVSPNLKEVVANDKGIQLFMKMASSLCQ